MNRLFRHLNERGIALITTMLMMLLMSALLVSFTTIVMNDQRYRGIDKDRVKLDHDYAEHRYYSEREQQALRDGHYLSAWWYGWRRHHEEREINARRADLHRDHERLDRYPY